MDRGKAAVPVLQQLRLIADQAGSERLVIIDGKRPIIQTCSRSEGWKSESIGLALTSGDKPVGIYAFTVKIRT